MTSGSRRADALAVLALALVTIALWAPRLLGPIDLRWDGGVYYLLGTSLAEGQGYRLRNEPGQIAAIQYPPLLPAVVAVHQRVLGSDDPAVVGPWLRASTFVVFVAFVYATWRLLRRSVPAPDAALGAIVAVLSLQTWFLSNALYPEIWFAVATLLFVQHARATTAAGQAAAYASAVASYALRTIGIAALVVWVAESALRGRFRQAAMRLALAALPVIGWQGYVTAVEAGDSYHRPAYEYQRAPYMFYNVSYATNMALRDPFTPEKGDAMIVRRVARNALDLPSRLAEAISIPRGYFEMGVHAVIGDGPRRHTAAVAVLASVLSLLGVVLIGGGTALQFLRLDTVIPLYVLVYLAAMLAAPFPGQYLRYLMPIVPLLVLQAILLLRSVSIRPAALLVPAIALQLAVVVQVQARESAVVRYGEFNTSRPWPLYFYGEANREFDDAITYLRRHAGAHDIVAAGTPHWIHLRTGLKTVMPPFEHDASTVQRLLEQVPVEFLIVGQDVVGSERYTAPAVAAYPSRWRTVYVTPARHWVVYQRSQATRVVEPIGDTLRSRR